MIYEIFIGGKTTRALGLKIPDPVLVLAAKVVAADRDAVAAIA